jgi:hypothetical protein
MGGGVAMEEWRGEGRSVPGNAVRKAKGRKPEGGGEIEEEKQGEEQYLYPQSRCDVI